MDFQSHQRVLDGPAAKDVEIFKSSNALLFLQEKILKHTNMKITLKKVKLAFKETSHHFSHAFVSHGCKSRENFFSRQIFSPKFHFFYISYPVFQQT